MTDIPTQGDIERSKIQSDSTNTHDKEKKLQHIKFDDLPKPIFPTKYFGYIYERADCGNPYSNSKMNTLFCSRNITNKKGKTKINKEIIDQELLIFKQLDNYQKYVIIIRLEDLTAIYKDDK